MDAEVLRRARSVRLYSSKSYEKLLDRCLRELQEAQAAGPNARCFFVVPQVLRADIERRYQALCPERPFLLADILSIEKLCERFLEMLQLADQPALSEHGQALRLHAWLCESARKAAYEHAAEPYPSLVACQQDPAFALQIVDLFSELRGAEIGADCFLEAVEAELARARAERPAAADAIDTADPPAAVASDVAVNPPTAAGQSLQRPAESAEWERVLDLARLYRAYQAKSAEQPRDYKQNLALLIEALNRPQDVVTGLESLQQTRIWLVGLGAFKPLTRQEQRFLAALAPRVQALTLALLEGCPHLSKRRAELQREWPTLQAEQVASLRAAASKRGWRGRWARWRALAKRQRLKLPLEHVDLDAAVAPSEATPSPAMQPEVWAAPTDESLRRFAAVKILDYLQTGQYQPEDLAVLYLGEGSFEETLTHFALELAENRTLKLIESPFYQFLQAFLELTNSVDDERQQRQSAVAADRNFHAPNYLLRLQEMALSGFWAVDWSAFELLQNLAELQGWRSRSDFLEYERWGLTDEAQLARLRDFVESKLRPLFTVAHQLCSTTAGLHKPAAFWRAMATLDLRRRLETWVNGGASRAEAQGAVLLWQQLLQLLEESEHVFGETEISQRSWSKFILKALGTLELSQDAQGQGRIRLLRPQDVLFHPCKVLLVLGLREERLPGSVNEGLLSDACRQALNAGASFQTAGRRLPLAKELQADLAELYLRALPKVPSERLVIVQEGSEKDLQSSLLQIWLQDWQLELQPLTDETLAWAQAVVGAAREQDSAAEPTMSDEPPEQDSTPSLMTSDESPEQDSAPAPTTLEARAERLANLQLAPASIQDLHSSSCSISAIESYAACPYEYFWSQQIGLQEGREDASSSRLRGLFMSRLFELALGALQKRWLAAEQSGGPSWPEILADELGKVEARAEEQLQTLLAEDGFALYARPGIQAHRLARMKRVFCLAWPKILQDYQQNEDFRPFLQGLHVELRDAEAGMVWTDKIDRIDRSVTQPERFRLYDLTTASSSNNKWGFVQFLAGMDLKLPFYAQAWQALGPAFVAQAAAAAAASAAADLAATEAATSAAGPAPAAGGQLQIDKLGITYITDTAKIESPKAGKTAAKGGKESKEGKEGKPISQTFFLNAIGMTQEPAKVSSELNAAYGRFALQLMRARLQQLRAGAIPARPLDAADACKHCAYSHLCLRRERPAPLKLNIRDFCAAYEADGLAPQDLGVSDQKLKGAVSKWILQNNGSPQAAEEA